MIKKKQINKITNLAKDMRKIILEVSLTCGEPTHIGGALSITDIMATLYGKIFKYKFKRSQRQICIEQRPRLFRFAERFILQEIY